MARDSRRPQSARAGQLGLKELRQTEIDKYIKVYAEAPGYGSHGDSLREMIDTILGSLVGSSLVDLSCGRGAAMEIARRHFETVQGTEAVPELLGPDVVFALAHKLPFEDNAFDVVLSTGVMEHLLPEDTYPALREMRRVSNRYVVITLNNKPGYFHINCPSYDAWDDIFTDIFGIVEYLGDMGNGGENRAWLVDGTG